MYNPNQPATYLGADLGGTKLLIGEMDGSGRLLRHRRWPSGPLTQAQALALIERGLDEFLAEEFPGSNPAAIGVGMVGRIDSRNGVWHEIDADRAEVIPAAQRLSDRCGLPCFIDNDVRSATKAEMLFGRGHTSRHFLYINVGTGIAAGVVTDGRLISGGHFNGGEVGHTSSGLPLHTGCCCGRDDCVEPVASGSGFDRCARLLAPRYPDTRLTIPQNGGRVSVKEVFALYDTDPLCRTLTDNAAAALANLIMNLVRVTDPDTIVLGGGVVSDGFLYPKIMERLDPHTIRFVTGGISLTRLDPSYIGLLGACSNAVMGMEERPCETYDCKKRA